MTDEEYERLQDILYMEAICDVPGIEAMIYDWEMFLQASLQNIKHFSSDVIDPAICELEPEIGKNTRYDDRFVEKLTKKIINKAYELAMQSRIVLGVVRFPKFYEEKAFFEEHKHILSDKDRKEFEKQLAICEKKVKESKARTKKLLESSYDMTFNYLRKNLTVFNYLRRNLR